MFFVRLIAIVALATALSGCATDGALDAGLGGGGLALGGLGSGLGAASQPGTDAFVKQELERRGI